MPNIDFTLPHWAYWVGLLVFPLVAAALAKRPRKTERRYVLGLGYFILLTGGMLGLHRFYLKNLLGLLFIPVFIAILYANAQGQGARATLSDLTNAVRMAERTTQREGDRVKTARTELPKMKAELAAAEPGSFAEKRAQRNVQRAEDRIKQGEDRIAAARATLTNDRPPMEAATAQLARWRSLSRYAFWLIPAAMAVDALLLPLPVRRANARLPAHEENTETQRALQELEAAENKEDSRHISAGWSGWIDRLSLWAGEFVAYWAVIAVFVYYFEVISRYVFNSPTNWAHEAMYLMFGMQYLISGAYAMLTESHVRVDIFYAPLSPRRKAWVDLFTSVFFFIFAGTLLMTSYIFAMDAIAVSTGNGLLSQWARGEIPTEQMLANWNMAQWSDTNIRWGEISFNEWEVPLWPMKWVMVIGALLLVLQGVAKFAKDVREVMGRA